MSETVANALMLNKGDLENNLIRVHEWVKAADQKVSIFFALQGIIITLLVPQIFAWISKDYLLLSRTVWIIIIVGFSLILRSIVKSISALSPRVKRKAKSKSLLFFGDIASLSLDQFKKATREITEEQYLDDLLEQTHTSAVIADKKYTLFKDSIYSFIVGVLMLTGSYIWFRF